jgi:hypothetical protein
VVEDQPLQPVARFLIEILEILHDRHFIRFSRSNGHFRSPCFVTYSSLIADFKLKTFEPQSRQGREEN